MDASCKIQRSIHDVRLTYKYVSRILGTYQCGMRCAFFQWRIRTLRYFLYNLCTSKQNLSGFFAVSGSQYRSDQIVRNIPWTIRNYPSGTTGNNRVYPQQWRPFLIHQGIWRENQFCLDHALCHPEKQHRGRTFRSL